MLLQVCVQELSLLLPSSTSYSFVQHCGAFIAHPLYLSSHDLGNRVYICLIMLVRCCVAKRKVFCFYGVENHATYSTYQTYQVDK